MDLGKGPLLDMSKKLPIGIEDFKKIRTEGFYYVDKTGSIVGSLEDRGEDILIEVSDLKIGIVVEVKYAGNGDLETSCQHALEQIQEKRYAARLEQDGMDMIIQYGIAC